MGILFFVFCFFVFQAEDGIRALVRFRGLGDVYKRQDLPTGGTRVRLYLLTSGEPNAGVLGQESQLHIEGALIRGCVLYTSDAADDLPCLDFGGRRLITNKQHTKKSPRHFYHLYVAASQLAIHAS